MYDVGVWDSSLITPRVRVISDNDYSGDPDGLVQLAHLLLTRSVTTVGVIGSHLPVGDGWARSGVTADDAAFAASDLAARCGRDDVAVVAGSNLPLTSSTEPITTAASELIVREAMRDDTDLPLYITCGGGLTDVASAWLIEPRIAERCTIIWIGGHEHDGLAEPPQPGMDLEYNVGIDHVAAQVVFNDSDLHLWQVPRDQYRSVLASRAEMIVRMRTTGPLGAFLFDALGSLVDRVTTRFGLSMGETYVLGDSPLVGLVALTTAFEPGPASNRWTTMPCPRIADSGRYEARPDGRPLRVFTMIDTRGLLEDLYAKLALHAAGIA